jgi:hypothetical protein
MSDVVLATNTVGRDKTFAKSTQVDHQKVSFYTRLGINLPHAAGTTRDPRRR